MDSRSPRQALKLTLRTRVTTNRISISVDPSRDGSKTGAMANRFRFSDVNAQLQTMQPKLRWRVACFFLLAFAVLAWRGYATNGVYSAFYWGLAVVGGFGLSLQYRSERAVVHNHISAVGVVTDYNDPLSWVPRFILALAHTARTPQIKYSFVAFDQKFYMGETGWNAAGLYKGAPITILYNPENPALNHPLTSLIFYSFG